MTLTKKDLKDIGNVVENKLESFAVMVKKGFDCVDNQISNVENKMVTKKEFMELKKEVGINSSSVRSLNEHFSIMEKDVKQIS